MRLFGTSGIRTVADKNLIELALKVGLAVGRVYDSVVVGCDTRTSRNLAEKCLSAAYPDIIEESKQGG